jgi:hypothetical protein
MSAAISSRTVHDAQGQRGAKVLNIVQCKLPLRPDDGTFPTVTLVCRARIENGAKSGFVGFGNFP